MAASDVLNVEVKRWVPDSTQRPQYQIVAAVAYGPENNRSLVVAVSGLTEPPP